MPRKKKIPMPTLDSQENNIQVVIVDNPQLQSLLQTLTPTLTDSPENTSTVPKKRGRKPNGGKIVQNNSLNENIKETKTNVILHLKCFFKDLQEDQNKNNIGTFQSFSNKLIYDELKTEYSPTSTSTFGDITNGSINVAITNSNTTNDTKELWKKLKSLENNLHFNNIGEKKSACFWCTYDFDNPPIYIPKYFLKEFYHVYGCFCSPECSVAYLMQENIDSSIKFERYQLLNHIYSKIYDYKKNIKPAPNPYYMLEKYYGNLSIQEYRKLLSNERLFLVVDKPMTRIMPELHQDNDDYIISHKIIPSSVNNTANQMQSAKNKSSSGLGLGLGETSLKVKVSKRNMSKNTIVSEQFGILCEN